MSRKSLKTNTEKLDKSIVKENKQKKEVTMKEIEKALDNVDTTIVDETKEQTPNVDEVEKIVEEINKINDSQKEFSDNFENVKSQEEAEKLIKEELKKVEQEKETVEKIINRSQRERTSSWNGISGYGY